MGLVTILLGGIDRVCEASAVLCLQLAAEALNAQPKPDRVKVDELKPVRQSGSVQNREAAGQVDAYMKSHGMTQTVMAKRAGTTAKTLRKFLRTGKVRTSVFGGIAVAMATSKVTSSKLFPFYRNSPFFLPVIFPPFRAYY